MFFYIVLTPISTISGLRSTGNTHKYHQIDIYIYQCATDKKKKCQTAWRRDLACTSSYKKKKKNTAKFQKDQYKTIGGIELTRNPLGVSSQADSINTHRVI